MSIGRAFHPWLWLLVLIIVSSAQGSDGGGGGFVRYLYYAVNQVKVQTTEGAVNNGTLRMYDLGLTKEFDILFDKEGVTGIAATKDNIYYATGYPIRIKRVNSDRSVTTMIDLTPSGISSWDPVVQIQIYGDMLYWADGNDCRPYSCIRRCQLSGDSCLFPESIGTTSLYFLGGFLVVNNSFVVAPSYSFDSSIYLFKSGGIQKIQLSSTANEFIYSVSIDQSTNTVYVLGPSSWFASDLSFGSIRAFSICPYSVCESGYYTASDAERGVIYFKSTAKRYEMINFAGNNLNTLFELPPMSYNYPPYPHGLAISNINLSN